MSEHELRDLLADLPQGPWQYRPLEHDDWGTVRAADGAIVALARTASHGYVDHDAHREAKTDPYEKIGRLITAIPDMAARIVVLVELLKAASHALRSYQYGNGAPDLAKSVADEIDKAVTAAKGETMDCDCGAATEGKWAGVHSPGCASIKPRFYILIDREPVAVDSFDEWVRRFDWANRHVAYDHVGHLCVSTIFLGITYHPNADAPLLFETMIIDDRNGSPWMGYERRSATWAEAQAQHGAALAVLAAVRD